MAERTVVEWDKDDLDALGMLKIDLLALGMLSCIRRAFGLLRAHYGLGLDDPARVPDEDPAVYEMVCAADTIGVFQIESRAQMSMLPRLRPATFYDLVIEVAIVRPGPIQGDMVHPYLRRREGGEPVTFPVRGAAGGAGQDAGRAALPGAGDADRHRGGRLHARRGRRAAPRHGGLPPPGHARPLPGEAGGRHGGARLRPRVRGALLSRRSRASATTASPRATPPASPSWSTSRPGSSATTRTCSAPRS